MSTTPVAIKNRGIILTLLLLPVLIVGGSFALLADRLPDKIATHWSSTYPDEFTSTATFVPVCLALSILGAVVGLIVLGQRRKPGLLFGLLFTGGFLSWTVAGVFVGSAVPTALAETPETAVLGAMTFVMMGFPVIGLAPLWLSGVYQAYSKQFHAQRQERIDQGQSLNSSTTAAAQPTVELEEFNETMKAPWWMWMLGLVILGVGASVLVSFGVEGTTGDLTSMIIALATVLLVCPLVFGLSMIRVSINDERFKVSSAVFGFPMKTIKFDEIDSVTSEDINPAHWGGWGWRIIPGGSAVVLKTHEGLAFELKNSKRFAVTIQDSQRAAEQLNARMTRHTA